MAEADPARYVRGQYRGYLDVDGVAPDSQTETFCALRLEIDNWRWSGVPFFIRAGKSLPVTVTEVRVVFNTTPWLGFVPRDAPRPEAEPARPADRPETGRAAAHAGEGRRRGRPCAPSSSTWSSRASAARGRRRTRCSSTPRCAGDSSHFARQDAVEETWRVVQPLIDSPPPVEIYEPGTWGPASADELTRDYGGWRNPWLP